MILSLFLRASSNYHRPLSSAQAAVILSSVEHQCPLAVFTGVAPCLGISGRPSWEPKARASRAPKVDLMHAELTRSASRTSAVVAGASSAHDPGPGRDEADFRDDLRGGAMPASSDPAAAEVELEEGPEGRAAAAPKQGRWLKRA